MIIPMSCLWIVWIQIISNTQQFKGPIHVKKVMRKVTSKVVRDDAVYHHILWKVFRQLPL
jgi:hypothetical protein